MKKTSPQKAPRSVSADNKSSPQSKAPVVPDWVKSAIFYQIFPDRYAREKNAKKIPHLEKWDEPPTFHGFKGGHLQGITERLPQIKEAGFNAIYLTPVFQSAANHRYVTYDYFQVCPMLGGNEALRKLIDSCHKLGLRVVLDGVFNHTGRGFFAFNHIMENGAKSPYLDWFHINPAWLKAGKPLLAFPTHAEASKKNLDSYKDYGYKSWWNLPALPKFNTNNQAVRDFIFSVAEHWAKFGIDGWRLDVPGDIDDDSFWQEFRKRVKKVNPDIYIVGEIWDEANRWLQGDQFDAVMNYLLGKPILAATLSKKPPAKITARSHYTNIAPISAAEFVERAENAITRYHPNIANAQMNLLGSHDTPRIASLFHGDTAGLKMALTLLYTLPGAPCVYYGDEIGMEGAHDPDCRRGFPQNLRDHLTANPKALEIRNHVSQLAKMRAKHKCLQEGEVSFVKIPDVVAFVRHAKGQPTCLVIANTSEHNLVFDKNFFDNHGFKNANEIYVEKRNSAVLFENLSKEHRSKTAKR
jgi:cyclomaltodextrinase